MDPRHRKRIDLQQPLQQGGSCPGFDSGRNGEIRPSTGSLDALNGRVSLASVAEFSSNDDVSELGVGISKPRHIVRVPLSSGGRVPFCNRIDSLVMESELLM